MNLAFFFLWLMVLVIVVILTILGFKNINQVAAERKVYVLNLNEERCYPNGSVTNLPTVSGYCCSLNGDISTKQISTNVLNYRIDMLIDINPVLPKYACLGFCENLDSITGKCLDETTGTSDYARCNQLMTPPPDCKDYSTPVASKGTTPYYAVERYVSGPNGNCPTVVPC